MPRLALTLVVKDYDFLAPLAGGDVVAEDLELTLDRDTAGFWPRRRPGPLPTSRMPPR
ncbi:MAG: hypothetical protein ACRDIY_19910 [Chloroflexota bacterium]